MIAYQDFSKIAKQGLAILLMASAIGCSSSSKNSSEPLPQIDENGDPIYSDGGTGEQFKQPSASQSATDPAVIATGSARYQALSRAVRSGKAEAIIQESAKILGENQNDAVALNSLALYHFRRGRVGAAKLLINRAFEKNPNSASLHNNLAIVLLEEGDQGGAINNFKRALRINDRHPEALGNLGSLYAQGGDYNKAAALLEQSYRQNRANAAIANNYAIALRVKKDYEGARRIYDEILAKNSKDVAALLNYSILLIDYLNKPKDGLALIYKVKFLESDKKEVLARANALEKKAKSELK